MKKQWPVLQQQQDGDEAGLMSALLAAGNPELGE
jgi:hypothetical protein